MKETRVDKEMEDSYTYNENTVISGLLFCENNDTSVYKNVFRYMPEKMLFNFKAKEVYKIIKYLCETEDAELFGTQHFTNKVKMIASIEYKGLDEYIETLMDYWCASGTLNFWIKKVQKFYFEQRFKEASTEEEFKQIMQEKGEYAIENDMVSMSDDVDFVLNNYESIKDTAVFTQYNNLNEVIGSFQGGDFVILAGASSSGKTCVMLNLIMGIAKSGKAVDVFSLEMPRYKLQQRMICSEVGIFANKFKSFSLNEVDKKKFIEYANGDFKKLNIRIFKKQTIGIEYIKAIVMKSTADIVFIDYLGLISGNEFKSSYERYSEISRELKLLAMASNKPIIALHQLNREFQAREDKRPKTSDIRDSGKIEQDADMILLVYRPSQFDEEYVDKTELDLIIAKNRDGESNKEVPFVFNGAQQRITEPIKI